jgi:putative methionine-R-sulfoxide reductase with GAF domain
MGCAARPRRARDAGGADVLDPRYLSCSPSVKSEIVVPILADGEVIGVLDIDSDEPNAFTDDDRRFLETLVSGYRA